MQKIGATRRAGGWWGCVAAGVLLGLIGCGGGDDSADHVDDAPLSERLRDTLSEDELAELRELEQGREAGTPHPHRDSAEASPTRTTTPDGGTAGSPTAFRRHEVREPSLGQTAYTLLVPKGWTLEASTQRTPPALERMFALTQVSVEAPDGRAFFSLPAFRMFYKRGAYAQPMQPLQGFFFSPPPPSVGRWLFDLARQNLDPEIRNLQLVSEDDVPEITALLRQQYQPLIQQKQSFLRQMGSGMQGSYDVGATLLRMTYEKNGRAMEQNAIVLWNLDTTYANGQLDLAIWGPLAIRGFAGPAGTDYANDPVLATISHSFQPTPAWAQAERQYFAGLNRPAPSSPAPATAAAAAAASGGSDVLDIMHRGWQKREGIKDAGQAASVRGIHEQTAYATPGGGTVNLSSHYNHAYTDGQGNYLLHNDANWNLNTDPNFNQGHWQRLDPTR